VRDRSKEATLREVLAEVSVLDVGAAFKNVMVQLGCVGIFIIISVVVGQGVDLVSSSESSDWGIPNWAIWLAIIWVFTAAYTSDYSYHDHRFAWYFPKLGWLGSIPLALYIFAAVQLFRAIDPRADWVVRTIQLLLAWLWLVPFYLSVAVLEIGHNRLMDKRTAAKAEREKNSPRAYDWLTDEDD
jgi:hypothetical protein